MNEEIIEPVGPEVEAEITLLLEKKFREIKDPRVRIPWDPSSFPGKEDKGHKLLCWFHRVRLALDRNFKEAQQRFREAKDGYRECLPLKWMGVGEEGKLEGNLRRLRSARQAVVAARADKENWEKAARVVLGEEGE